MQPTIRLTITRGEQPNEEVVFTEPAIWLVGRSFECHLCLLRTDQPHVISRRHCLLNIRPPFISIRDLGSRNGTYVNGELIGQRPRELSAAEMTCEAPPPHPLNDGDLVRVGDVFIFVRIKGQLALAATMTDGADTLERRQPLSSGS